jgi:hypothetical protein
MMDQPTETKDTRKPWIEPEVRELEVRETAAQPHVGGDGNFAYPDCNLS